MPITAQTQVQDAYWTSAEELFKVFGRSSVQRWADMENSGNKEEIADRVQYAVEWATVEAKSRLSGAPCGAIVDPPTNLRYAVTQLAAVQLYSGRGIQDNGDDREGRHRLLQHKRDADKFFMRVHAGQIRLQGTTPVTMVPTAIAPTTLHVPSRQYLTPEETMNANDTAEKTPVTRLFPDSQFISE